MLLSSTMDNSGKINNSGKAGQRAARKARLAAALRENLKRRKAQERQRSKLSDAPPSGHEASPHEAPAPPHGQVGRKGEE